MKSLIFNFAGCASLFGALILGLALPPQIGAAQEERFATPEAAVQALKGAAAIKDTNALNTIFGPELRSLVSAYPIQSSNRFVIFARRLSEKVAMARPAADKVVLDIGNDAWPFAIPLVRGMANGRSIPMPAGRKFSIGGSA